MAAALHHKAQIVLAAEIDGRHDIVGRLGGHRVDARARRPCVDPAETLRQPNLVSEVIRVLQFLENLCAARARRRLHALCKRRLNLQKFATDLLAEPVPTCFGGPLWVSRPDAAQGTGRRRGPSRADDPRPDARQRRDRCHDYLQ
jgi:hypothetical protein